MVPIITGLFDLDLGLHTWAALFITTTFVLLSIAWCTQTRQSPSAIPYIGQPPGRTGFSLRTYYRYYTDCSGLMREAYDKYLRHGKPVWIPGLGARKELILPNTSMKWALAQPSHLLNHRAGLLEVDFPRYLLGDDFFLNDPWHGHLVKAELVPVLDHVCAVMNIELEASFDDYFGNDTEEWREIDVLETVRKIIGRASSRFTVSEPLCRNESYIKHVYDMVDKTHLSTGLLLLAPRILHPILGPLIRHLATRRFTKMSRMIEAEYHARLASLQHKPKSPPKHEPNDFFQSILRYAQDHRPHELNLQSMTRRLFLANLGSMHRTAFLTTNVLLNIIDSDRQHNTIAVLRAEIARVLRADGIRETDMSSWNRPRTSRLFRTESVARETMRLQSFDNRSTICKVLGEGVVLGDGVTFPRGARVSFLGHPAQIDKGVYEDAETFDPFRFSRPFEAAQTAVEAGTNEDGKATAKTKKAPAGLGAQSFVSTGPYHLPFGHGRTACPGRWLVDFEVKMIVAYAVSRYELEFPPEYGGKRPGVTWMVEAMLPPKGAKIRVRRRKV